MSAFENEALVNRDNQLNDELSLLDLVAFVRKNLRILLGSALVGGVLGLVIAFVLPAQWEANALVRVGQLGSAENAENAGMPIEPSLLILDRIKNKSFQNNVLKAKLEKSGIISLALRGASPDEVKHNMSAVVNQLQNSHKNMAAPTINRWHQELALIDAELKQNSIEAERLTKLLNRQSDSLSEKNILQAVLLSNILIAREGTLRNLRDRKRILEEQFSPERTFDTGIIGQVEVSTKPVFPKKSLFTVAGLFMGLLLGTLFSMMKSIGSRMSVSAKAD